MLRNAVGQIETPGIRKLPLLFGSLAGTRLQWFNPKTVEALI